MRVFQRVVFIATSFLAVACSSGSDQGSSDDISGAFTINGSTGDGPIVGGDIAVTDANGALIASSISTNSATYQINVPEGTAMPVTVRVTGGTDLVTQRAVDFALVSVVSGSGDQTVNVSPLTTLVAKAAECADDMTTTRMNSLWQTVARDLNIGLDSNRLGNPQSSAITAQNLETAVLANESIGEWIRRTGAALTDTNFDQVIDTLACDLADGAVDGVLAKPVGTDDQRVLAVAKAVEVAIRLEVIAGRLEVDGQDSTSAMNASIRSVMPSMSNANVNNVVLDESAITNTIKAIKVLQGVYTDTELTAMVSVLASATLSNVRSQIDTSLTAANQNTLVGLPERVALADATEISDLGDRNRTQRDALAPFVSLDATPRSVDRNASSALSWASSNADQCIASGGWSAEKDLQGTFQTPALSGATVFELACVGLGGVTQVSVTVLINGDPIPEPTPDPMPNPTPDPTPTPTPTPDPDPTPAPTVSLSVNKTVVNSGGSVELNWSSTQADSCVASTGWSGNKATDGTERVTGITSNQTYTLTCQGGGGSAVGMVSVSVIGALNVSWQAPTENVDGTPISGLSAFRIHYGSASRNYDQVVEVSGSATSHTLNLARGEYYIALTAVDLEGDESALSNEILKQAL